MATSSVAKFLITLMQTASRRRSQMAHFVTNRCHTPRGDTLVVWKLDRLGRSVKHLVDLVGELQRKRPVFAVCTRLSSVVMMWGWWMLS